MQLFLFSSCLLSFALFYYSLLFLKFERGGVCNPRNLPPSTSRSANVIEMSKPWVSVNCIISPKAQSVREVWETVVVYNEM